MKEITLKSYGKINLCLDVGGIRQDGFHEIETVMQRISLHDEVQIQWIPEAGDNGRRRQEPIAIELTTNKASLPTDDSNLACKAAKLMADVYGTKAAGVGSGLIKIDLTKNIPVAAGLAGGSGNCAAVLIGLNRLWGLGLSTQDLCGLAEKLGSDIPFCVLVQNTSYDCALATGRGEVLTPIERGMKKQIVLAKPDFGVSTKEVFENIDKCNLKERPDSRALIMGLAKENDAQVYNNMINVLEAYTLEQYKAVRDLKALFWERTEAKKVLMSGSGPTVFGIYDTVEAARKGCDAIRSLKYEAHWACTMGR